MHEDILRKLEQRVSRRTFLRGSALGAIALVGMAAFPALAFAQNPQQPQPGDKPGERNDRQKGEPDSGEKTDSDKDAEKKDPNAPTEDEFKITHKDENGRDYRVCPQCGYNMYRQDRTWTCENCGYSYTE